MSWKALDWATDLEIDPATAEFILLLLANKADENFACFSFDRIGFTMLRVQIRGQSSEPQAEPQRVARGAGNARGPQPGVAHYFSPRRCLCGTKLCRSRYVVSFRCVI
jgi:hypothetical protein